MARHSPDVHPQQHRRWLGRAGHTGEAGGARRKRGGGPTAPIRCSCTRGQRVVPGGHLARLGSGQIHQNACSSSNPKRGSHTLKPTRSALGTLGLGFGSVGRVMHLLFSIKRIEIIFARNVTLFTRDSETFLLSLDTTQLVSFVPEPLVGPDFFLNISYPVQGSGSPSAIRSERRHRRT